jgi:uncharacterized protein YecT (DUF1311 family)
MFSRILGFTALTLLTLGVGRDHALWDQAQAANAQSKVPYSETQRGMNEVAGKDFAKADAEMNSAYKKLIRSVNQAAQAKLRNSQRHWLKFRDAEAEFRSMTVIGGSAYPMVYAGNRATLTRARTRELNDAYSSFNTEGTM